MNAQALARDYPRKGKARRHALQVLFDVASHFMVFDLLSMPLVSLVQHAQMEGEYYELPNGLQFPVGMQYFKAPFPAIRGIPR